MGTPMCISSPRTMPRHLYIELTTLCNLGCAMCVKHSAGWTSEDALMSRDVFTALQPVMTKTDKLILNGIGESLLHPDVEDYIAFAREHTQPSCVIGFQSNGMLLTAPKAEAVLDAGLDRICFSVDSPRPEQLELLRSGAELDQMGRAFDFMRAASTRPGARPVSVGAQTVISAQNYTLLPDMVRWFAQRGAEFMIVSHILPYRPQDQAQSLYEPTSQRCLDFYQEWKHVFATEGMDVSHSYHAFYAVFRTPAQQRQVEVMLAMLADARARNLQFSLPKIMHIDTERMERVRAVLANSYAVAQDHGLELRLPELAAREPRDCPFVRTPSLFVAHDGTLAPCYYLWHGYSTWLEEADVRVRQPQWGRVPQDDPLTVWHSPEFVRFRDEARSEEYARCGDCSVAPCDYVSGILRPFERDCYGQTVPCGICPWSGGGFACLD